MLIVTNEEYYISLIQRISIIATNIKKIIKKKMVIVINEEFYINLIQQILIILSVLKTDLN